MKSSRRKAWVVSLARRHVRSKLRRSFAGIHIAGLDAVRALAARQPVIVAANHSAWWDALLAMLVDELLGTESYCLMDAANLRRLPFLGWVGAVPLDSSSPRATLHSLRASMSLLDRPGRVLWVFAQGKQRPAHLRPLGLQRGVELLASKSGAPVVPMALRYDFLESPKPEVNIWLGRPLAASEHAAGKPAAGEHRRGRFLDQLEHRLVDALERIDRHLLVRDPTFATVLGNQGRATLPLGGKVLALIGRGGHSHD